MIWEISSICRGISCCMQGYGKYTIYRRKLLNIELCLRILAIILVITSLGHRHRYHYPIAIPIIILSSLSSLRLIIPIIITSLGHRHPIIITPLGHPHYHHSARLSLSPLSSHRHPHHHLIAIPIIITSLDYSHHYYSASLSLSLLLSLRSAIVIIIISLRHRHFE